MISFFPNNTPRPLAVFVCFCLFFAVAAAAQRQVPYQNLSLQTGDLIFVGEKKEQLSGAINRVTQREINVSFDHVGILEVEEEVVYILHASTEKGSVREPLDSLVSRARTKDKQLVVYRLSDDVQASIPEAIATAKIWLGKPYNWTYVLNDSSLYCSDYVERAFRHAGLFRLEPMTFVNPETGQTDAYWKEFYKKLDMEVPEGLPGCNPNGLAASEHLRKVGELVRSREVRK